MWASRGKGSPPPAARSAHCTVDLGTAEEVHISQALGLGTQSEHSQLPPTKSEITNQYLAGIHASCVRPLPGVHAKPWLMGTD